MPVVYSTTDGRRENPTEGRIPGIRGRVAIRRRERAAPEYHSDLAFPSPNPLSFSICDPNRGPRSGPRTGTIPPGRPSCQAKSPTYRSPSCHHRRMWGWPARSMIAETGESGWRSSLSRPVDVASGGQKVWSGSSAVGSRVTWSRPKPCNVGSDSSRRLRSRSRHRRPTGGSRHVLSNRGAEGVRGCPWTSRCSASGSSG
jgi:hypothetical protein